MKSDLLAPLALPVLLLLAQCSPVAPPLARGSAHFQAQGVNCNNAYGGIGNPPPEVANTLSEMDLHREGMVVDGEQPINANAPYDITCTISGSGELIIEGRLEGPNTSPFVAAAGSSTNIEISGRIGLDGVGSGSVGFFTTSTLAVSPKEGTTCSFAATPTPLKACSNQACSGGGEPLDYGTMAITFSCPEMNMGAASIGAACEANGTILLDRCTH
jgi:hypothetical protein